MRFRSAVHSSPGGLVVAFLVAVFLGTMAVTPAAFAAHQELPPPPLRGLLPGPPPEVTALTWILYDETFEVELASQDADLQRPMASTTKMMTALVALENAALDDLLVVSEQAASVGESEVPLEPGEAWPLDELLKATLVSSANDAAMTVAEGVGGSLEAFVDMMNDKAVDLGLENTQFANPHGLDAPGHFSSARDLLTIAQAGLGDETFSRMVARRVIRLPDDPDGDLRIARTTNRLLGDFPGSFGVKTGFTDDAGLALVAGAERNGRRLMVVVLGSTNHFADASALLEYGFEGFGLMRVIAAGDTYAELVTADTQDEVTAASSADVFIPTTGDEELAVEPEFVDREPILVARVDGQELARVDGVVTRTPKSLPTFRSAVAWASRYWDWLWGQ